MPVDLGDLITASFDAAAAEAWSKFALDEADKLALREAAMKVLGLFPQPHGRPMRFGERGVLNRA
jgi:hypothetical protein